MEQVTPEADRAADLYKIGVGHLQEQLPQVVEAYNRFTGECFSAGTLSAREKQLIALGIALFAGNETCTSYHVQEALSEGASAREIMEAVSVAAAIGGGHVLSQGVTRVQNAMAEHDGIMIQ